MARYAFSRNGIVFRVAEWNGVGSEPTVTATPVGTAVVQPGDGVNSDGTFGPAPTPSATYTANRDSIVTKGVQALTSNQTFLAIPSPTNPQSLAQIQSLTRQMNGLIRLILDKLDVTDGT